MSGVQGGGILASKRILIFLIFLIFDQVKSYFNTGNKLSTASASGAG